MKKILPILIMLFLCLSAAAASAEQPAFTFTEAYEYAMALLEAAESKMQEKALKHFPMASQRKPGHCPQPNCDTARPCAQHFPRIRRNSCYRPPTRLSGGPPQGGSSVPARNGQPRTSLREQPVPRRDMYTPGVANAECPAPGQSSARHSVPN